MTLKYKLECDFKENKNYGSKVYFDEFKEENT